MVANILKVLMGLIKWLLNKVDFFSGRFVNRNKNYWFECYLENKTFYFNLVTMHNFISRLNKLVNTNRNSMKYRIMIIRRNDLKNLSR